MKMHYRYEWWPESIKSKRFEKLFSIEDPDTLSKAERVEYDRWLKEYRDLQNCLDTAYEQGYLQRLAANNAGKTLEEKREIAREYFDEDFTIEQVVAATGLSTKEVKKIQKEAETTKLNRRKLFANKETIRKMLTGGFSLEKIATWLGFSQEYVAYLAELSSDSSDLKSDVK